MNAKQLRYCVRQFRKGLLAGKSSKDMCFVVSVALSGYMHAHGYDTWLTNGRVGRFKHWWIQLDDGTIIDATADQFLKPNGKKMPAIYIGPMPVWYTKTKK